MRQAFAELAAQHPDVQFRIGVECTGGLERNWLQFFRALDYDKKVYRLNALAVKRFLETDLHRGGSDEISARGIAAYLRRGLRPADVPYEPELEGPRTLCRHVLNTLSRGAQIRNELQSLLSSAHPGLVQYCRKGMPQWVLLLLVKFPTAARLAAASPEEMSVIHYMKASRVRELIAAAQCSVAALGDETTGLVISDLAKEALELHRRVEEQKRLLWEQLKKDEETKILKSIRGIGRWTAVVLRLEMGPFGRFHSDRAAVAFAGLDPRVRQSGDVVQHLGISRRGREQVRACLYMPMLTALRDNPVFKEFYARLRAEGKIHMVAITACMAKMIRIAYACVVSGQMFDPSRHELVKAKHEAQRKERAEADRAKEAAQADKPAATGALDAPVSQREAKRRRQAAAAARPRAIICGG